MELCKNLEVVEMLPMLPSQGKKRAWKSLTFLWFAVSCCPLFCLSPHQFWTHTEVSTEVCGRRKCCHNGGHALPETTEWKLLPGCSYQMHNWALRTSSQAGELNPALLTPLCSIANHWDSAMTSVEGRDNELEKPGQQSLLIHLPAGVSTFQPDTHLPAATEFYYEVISFCSRT